MTEKVVGGGISVNEDSTLNFGDFLSAEKVKVDDFDAGGHLYKVRTSKELTRLERDGKLLLECVPGASVWNFRLSEGAAAYTAKGAGVTGFTHELVPETNYRVYIGSSKIGELKSNISGKISFSAELSEEGADIKIEKVTP